MITSRWHKPRLIDGVPSTSRRGGSGIATKTVADVRVSPYLESPLKRIFDITVALVGLAVLAVVLPIAGAAVCATSRGPVFYKRARVGKGDVPFAMIKFRTMIHGSSESSEQLRTQFGDPRITRVGKILRKTYLDELPQFINVLKGEMSVVGPRPEFPELSVELTKARPEFAKRTLAKPGITGLAQVAYRHATDDQQAARRVYYDLKYIRNASLRLDIVIVLKTIQRAARLGGY